MESTLEFLTTRKPGREGHRHWPGEIKAKIVSESLRPGTTVNEVAQRYGLRANSLSTWRTVARQGKLILPAPEDAVEFAAMVIETPAPEPRTVKAATRPEIVIGPVTIRLRGWTHDAKLRYASFKGVREVQDNADVYRVKSVQLAVCKTEFMCSSAILM
ncbi:transposase [Agrobacterium tumefaciens]|uniref:transposase n=1 Tax=Agrobacterium tumefaciens TaxID=358 RepID=UPI001BB4F156|nr:transposase [Agrobacterium tumefaciens]